MANKGSITIGGGKRGSTKDKGGRTAQVSAAQGGARKAAPTPGQLNLGKLFGAAAESMDANREQLNALDGFNGNHGDNMAYNMRTVAKALQANRAKPPAVALRAAAETLGREGQGGTGQYYAKGLARAADQFEGRTELGQNDLMTLLQTVMGSVPAQSQPEAQAPAGGSLLEMLMGGLTAAGAGALPQGAQAPEAAGGGLLEGLLSMAAGGATGQPTGQADAGLGMGDLLNVGLSLLGGGGAGGGTTTNVLQTLLGALAGGGGGGGGREYNSPREASGSLLMQSLLQAFLGGR